MSFKYVYEKTKEATGVAIGRKMTLCYVRIRCPCCGMWSRLDNLKREQPLFEESTCYSSGDKGLFHDKKTNPSLKTFWIIHLKHVLERMGYVEKPYSYDCEMPYNFRTPSSSYHAEKEVSYRYD